MHTGENEHGLQKILDMTRMISIVLLLLHFYYYLYVAFREWRLTSVISDRILTNFARTGLFNQFYLAKSFSLLFLGISLMGARGKKDGRVTSRAALSLLASGLLLFYTSFLLLKIESSHTTKAILYMAGTGLGYIFILTGGTWLSRIFRPARDNDPFSRKNVGFPQEERLVTNQYSINLPAEYILRGRTRRSWINIVNPFRGLLILGTPGSGKTYFLIQHIIKQQIQKGFAMVLLDYKYDDLSRIAYNYFLKYRHVYPGRPAFYNINFDDLSRSHRCNPLAASTLMDITDAAESARTILLGLNKEWVEKQGEFFQESAIIFITALIWFLRRYQEGIFCSWPHVIELAQAPYRKLFSILRARSEFGIGTLINPFVNALLHGAFEQLEGQIASATISLGKLSSAPLYYVLTGSDFTLDINYPERPAIVCLGNNPQRTHIYGAVLSVYINTITRLTNRKGRHPMAINLDEFSTVIVNSIDKTIATGRSNKIAVTIALQDASQLKLAYGKEYADVVINTCGNLISGQVTGDTAKFVSDRFGKISQEKESTTTTTTDINVTRSTQLEEAVPASRIASLSSGEFVGMVADNPDQEIQLKGFCCKVINDHAALKKEEARFAELPLVREITPYALEQHFMQIKNDVADLVESEIARMMDSPDLQHLIID